MCVSAGTITKAVARSPEHNTWDSSITPKKRRIPSLFSRDKSNDLPERANISLCNTPRGKDKKKPLLTFEAITQAFAVYPERPDRISSSALIKLEGTYGDEEMCANMKHREGWMLLMPGLEGGQSITGGMLRWLIGGYIPFAKSC
jgi:CCR4-NOT transcriptional complex subunit CAF120